MSALPIAADDAAAIIIAIRTSSFLFIVVGIGMYLDILCDVFCFALFCVALCVFVLLFDFL